MVTKEKQINIRVSEKELSELEKKAKEKGLKRSDYIRSLLFNDDTESITNDIQMYTVQNLEKDKVYLKERLVEAQKNFEGLLTEFKEVQKKANSLNQDLSLEKENSAQLMIELNAEKNKGFFARLFRK
jgi:ribbon-helix-helix protein, copG family